MAELKLFVNFPKSQVQQMWSICSENNREGFEKISCKFTKWKLVPGLFLKKMQLLQDYHDGIII